jgi:hypothetical protein
MNSTKRLSVNTKCFPTSFRQGRLGRLYIYSVKKGHLGAAIEDMYLGYLTKMTQQNLIGIGMGPHLNNMVVEYPSEIEPYLDKIKSCN